MSHPIDRLGRHLSHGTPGPQAMSPHRVFIGTVTAVDGGAGTATVGGVAYKCLAAPTAYATNDRVLVMRIGVGQGIILGKLL